MSRASRRGNIRIEPILNVADHPPGDPAIDPGLSMDAGEAPAIPDPPVQPERTRIELSPGPRAGRRVIIFASILLLISFLLFAADQLLSPDTFEIQELRISADFSNLSPEEVRHEVLTQIRNNYFAVDLKRIENAVRELPWVDKVSVRRQWPGAIHVRLIEQVPVARWGEQEFLNERSEVFRVTRAPAYLNNLPLIHGPAGTEKQLLDMFAQWKRILEEKQLALTSLHMSARYSLQIEAGISRAQQRILTEQALLRHFETTGKSVPVIDWRMIAPFTLTLRLGKEDVEQRLRRFLAVYPDAFEDQLLQVDKVDLRYPNGFAVEWREDFIPGEFVQLAVMVEERS